MLTKIFFCAVATVMLWPFCAVAGPLDSLLPGQWYQIPNSKIRSVVPNPLPAGLFANEGPGAVVWSWSGGLYDSKRDRLVVWGGGHGAYAGNEIYAFDINALSWTRVTDPSSLTGFTNGMTTYADGRPVSVHTYDQLIYDPSVDRMFAFGGSRYSSGSATDAAFTFNFDTKLWTQVASIPGDPYSETNGYSLTSAYDPVTKLVYIGGLWSLTTYNVATNTWKLLSKNYGGWELPNGLTAALDSKRRQYVQIGRGYAFIWDISVTAPQRVNLVTSGAKEIEQCDAPGLEYDPVSDRVVGWCAGSDVYTLNMDTKVWSKITATNSVTPGDPRYVDPVYGLQYHGTFGRFRYVPSKNIFIVVTDIDRDVFVYKLSAGGVTPPPINPPPTVTFSATPVSIASGASATLTWSSTNASSCAAKDAWSGRRSTANTFTVRPAVTSTYTITCSGAGGSASQSVTITVTGVAPPPTGAITTVQLINTSAISQTNAVTTFGHVFKQGDVPAGSTVIAKDSGGNPVILQVDKKATHADGSLRHAILTAKLPSLSASATQAITLFAQANGAAPPAVSLASLLATAFDSQVSLNVGGTVYSASAKDLLQNATPKPWLAGPVVSEWIVGGPVKNGGAAHAHLTAYFHVRAYAGSTITKVRVDAVVENNWTSVSSPQDFTYDVTLSVGGSPVYTKSALTHFTRARWHKTFWWGTDPCIYVKHDKNYLQDSRAVPKYMNVTPSEATLAGMLPSINPMEIGNILPYMASTGENMMIGPLPEWAALYLVSMDRRAYIATLRNADGGASFNSHYRDEVSGYPATPDDHPDMQIDNNTTTWVPPVVSTSPYAWDMDHQPSLAYVPYLVTGDYYYLEELQF